MLDFTWEVFSWTGNVDTYLLYKEIEGERQEGSDLVEDPAAVDFPIS